MRKTDYHRNCRLIPPRATYALLRVPKGVFSIAWHPDRRMLPVVLRRVSRHPAPTKRHAVTALLMINRHLPRDPHTTTLKSTEADWTIRQALWMAANASDKPPPPLTFWIAMRDTMGRFPECPDFPPPVRHTKVRRTGGDVVAHPLTWLGEQTKTRTAAEPASRARSWKSGSRERDRGRRTTRGVATRFARNSVERMEKTKRTPTQTKTIMTKSSFLQLLCLRRFSQNAGP